IPANMPAWVTAVAPIQGTSTQTGTSQDFVFTPTDSYTSFVTFSATNSSGTSSATAVISILNVAPTANFSAPTVSEGQIAGLTFSNPFDPSIDDTAAGFTYSYDFNNDGIFEVPGSSSSGVVLPASLTADGPTSFTVRGRITDKDGGFTDYTTTVQVT